MSNPPSATAAANQVFVRWFRIDVDRTHMRLRGRHEGVPIGSLAGEASAKNSSVLLTLDADSSAPAAWGPARAARRSGFSTGRTSVCSIFQVELVRS